MKRLLPIAVDRADPRPLYRQIYARVRSSIESGALSPGDRLPSARALASTLGAARGTIEEAYGLLAAEGYVVRRGPAGSVIAPGLERATPTRKRVPPKPPPLLQGISILERPLPFGVGLPAFDSFPRKLWARLVARQGRALVDTAMSYPDARGHGPLREAIARYLTLSRGIVCSAEQVLVTGGYQSALDLVARVVLQAGDAVWFEEPGYYIARRALEATLARLVPVRVDGEGLRVADGIAQAPEARLAVVTPAHQSPLGMSLSLARRLALLAWAADRDAWILEDDYDGEFHYAGRPLPALKSIDREQRVLYAGSFSKALYPGLRLGYLVVPDQLQPAFLAASRLRDAGQATFGQAVVACFMEEGHFVRHLKRMRALYAARRGALAEALGSVFGDRMTIELPAGGLHLLADLAGPAGDAELSRRAYEVGLSPPALSLFAATHPRRQGLLLGFTNIPESQALKLSRQLARALS